MDVGDMQKWMKRVASAVYHGQRRRAIGVTPAAAVPQTPVVSLAGRLLSQKQRLSGDEAAALSHHLSALQLKNALSEYDKLARLGVASQFDHRQLLLHLAKCEIAAREGRRTRQLIRAAGFPPALPGGDAIDLPPAAARQAQPFADGEWVADGDNIIVLGGARTGKTALLLALGQQACRRGLSVRYATAAALVEDLLAAHEQGRLMALHRRLDSCALLLLDDLGATRLAPAGAALLFEVLSRRSERRSTVVASTVPPLAWSRLFGSARLANAVVERLAHRLHRIDLGGVDPLAWATRSEAEPEVWHAEPVVAPARARGAERRRAVVPAPVRSA